MGNRAPRLPNHRRRGDKQQRNAAVETRRCKVVILGSSGVGKTTLFRRLLDQSPPSEYGPSTAVEIGAKLIQLEGKPPVLAELWDVPHRVYGGKDIFATYLKGVDGVMLVYDINSPASWQAVVDYHKLTKEHASSDPPATVSVVGTKLDTLKDPHEQTEAISKAKEWVAAQNSAQEIQHHVMCITEQHAVFEILRSSVKSMLVARPSA